MKKKIILIRNAKHYDFGGGERFPVFLAETLERNNWRPTIISRSPTLLSFASDHSIRTIHGWWWSYQNWSGKFIILTPLYVLWQIILFLWYIQLFIREQPDTIHIQSKDDFIAATLAGKLLGKCIVWTDHADLKHIWLNLGIWYKNPIGKLVYFAAHFADSITVVSNSEFTLVSRHLSAQSTVLPRIKIIYNGIVDHYGHYQKQDNHSSSLTTFCTASRLVTDKGIGEIISAFNSLEVIHPNIQLILLGDGPEAEKFKKLAKAKSKVKFLGYQKDPLKYIADADIFVQPTYHEGFSVALVEAAMLARPTIATAVGGNLEIIQDNKTGLLVNPKDEESLYNAMLELLEDKQLRQRLGKEARKQYRERFDFDHITTDQFIPLYKGDNS